MEEEVLSQDSIRLDFEKLQILWVCVKEMNVQAQQVPWKKRPSKCFSMCPSGAQLLPFSFPRPLLIGTARRQHPEDLNPTHTQHCFQGAGASHHQIPTEMGFYNAFPHGSCRISAVWLWEVHQWYFCVVYLDFFVHYFHESTVLALHLFIKSFQGSC